MTIPRLPRRWRKAVLILHIIAGVGWIGVDLALLPLVITGLTTDEGETAAASYRAIAVLVPWTVPAHLPDVKPCRGLRARRSPTRLQICGCAARTKGTPGR